jgi:Family of unknown function (DUF5760)
MSSAASASAAASSDTKDQLVKHVKGWIQMDNEIKEFQKEIKERKDKKKEITDKLLHIMKDNEIDCFDINGGQLIYSKTKVKAPLNKNNLMSALLSFYQEDASQAEKLSTFLMETREEKIKESIRRKKV